MLTRLVVGRDVSSNAGNDKVRNDHARGTYEQESTTSSTAVKRKRSVFAKGQGSDAETTYSTRRRPGTVIPTLTTFVAMVMMKGLPIPEFLKN